MKSKGWESMPMSDGLLLRALEPRILLDAAAVTSAVTVVEPNDAQAGATAATDNGLMEALSRAGNDTTTDTRTPAAISERDRDQEIFFIDTAVPEADVFEAQLPGDAEVYYLDEGQDGLLQIAEALSGRSDVDAVHIISHGGEGELRLGNISLDVAAMQNQYQDELNAIGGSLSADADILLYGCDFAAGDAGMQAVSLLSQLTGADVAASTDDTGASDLGGDWELEAATGAIEVQAFAAAEWDHLLTVPIVDLNSLQTTTQIVSNGSFDDNLNGWIQTGTAGQVNPDGQFIWQGNNTTGSLEQTGLSGWDTGHAPSGVAQLTFSAGYNNDNVGNSENFRAFLYIQVDGVSYVELRTPNINDPNVGTITYMNGATGNTSTFSGFAQTEIVVDLPADVATTGSLGMEFISSNGSSDDIRIDDLSAFTTSDTVADSGRDYTTIYPGGSPGVSIADTDNSVAYTPGADLQSATISLTNALAGDELVIGALPAGISSSIDDSVSGQITVTLTGAADAGAYADAVRAISFANNGGALPADDRIIEVTVSDGSTSSAVSTTTIMMDHDGDGVVNADDIDDDNDGLTDETEHLLPPTQQYVGPGFWDTSSVTLTAQGFDRGTPEELFDGDLDDDLRIDPEGDAVPYPDTPVLFYAEAVASARPEGFIVDQFFLANDFGSISDGIRDITLTLYDDSGSVLGVETLTNLSSDSSLAFTYDLSQVYTGVVAMQVAVTNNYTSGPQTGNEFQVREVGLALSGTNTVVRDTDSDDRLDHLDLDRDNDGITDNVEAQSTADYIQPSGIDADGDGLDDAYDADIGDITSAGSVGLLPVDTDGDTRYDVVDADSDDDGTPDVAERGDTGPTSITETTDTDGDGLLDIFEAGDINDGYDPNDENIDGSGIYNLADSDDDTDADGSNANPRGTDLDYRDDPSLAPPDAVDDTASTVEEVTLTVDVASGLLSNDDLGVSAGTVTSVLVDTDNDGVPDTEIPIGVATNILDSQGMVAGSLTVNADGSYSFIPVSNFEGPLPVISYTVTTEGGTGSANLTVTVVPVNDAPVLDNSVNLVYQVPEDSPAPSGQVGSLISEFTEGITDVDTGAETGIAIYNRSNSNGIWWYSTDNGTTWLQMGARSSSNALLLAADGQTRIYFQPTTANYHGTANNQLYYVAWDQSDGNTSGTTGVSIGSRGGGTAFSQSVDYIAREVTPVNDAPVLTDQNRRLRTINEDTTTSPPSGAVGTEVTYGYFRWTVSDVDTNADMNQRGIAITDSNETDGIWWYTIDNGVTWQQIDSVSDDNALLLEFSSSARVYFQANDDFNTGSGNISDALTIRAWDQTGGTNGGRADTIVNGGTTAFSTDTDVVYLDINPVADISNDLSNTTPEDTPITIEPIATDTFEGSNPQIVEIDDQSITPGGAGVAVEGGMVTLGADGQTLTYTPNQDYYANNNDFYYTVNSGGVTERALIRVHVTAVADAPRIDLDTTTAGADYATDYDNGPVAIGNLVSVTDPENNNLGSMTITIADATADTHLFAEGALPSGLTGSYDAGTGTYTITGNSSLANYQAALGQIRFENTSGTPGNWTLLVSAISVTAPTDSNTAQTVITMLDSDGDGIANAGDIDDDNDGVLDSVEGPEGPQNLVTNGDFTLGDFGFESDLEESMGGAYPSYNGVVANGDTGGNYTATWNPYGSSGGTRPDGSGAYLVTNDIAEAQGQEYAVTWRQTIEVSENTDLTLFFQLTTSGTNLDFLVDGVSLTGGVQNYSHNYDWRDYSFDFNSGERTSITIEFRQHTGGGAGDSGIDNIALLADLSDPDGDGLPNRLDLDSDNDGITDNVEAQTTQDYIHPSGQGAAMTDADGDGLDDVYDADTTDTTESASLGLTPVDTDGDGTPDYHDDDSDDDGTPDIVERGGTPVSITDTTDSDGDGLLDIFEGANVNDGYDVNDENLTGMDFNLADQDGDTAADGSNATPTDIDFDYRDNLVSPSLDLDGDDSSGATAADYDTTYTEGGPGVAIADGDVAITDIDSVNMVGATITLGNPETDDRLLMDGSDAATGVLASGISWTRTDTEVALSGTFSTADYQAALQLITFMSSNLMPPAGTRLVQVSVNDGTSSSNTATAAITVVPVNNPPVNTLPASGWTTPEDTAIALTGLSVADPDAGSGTITVTLDVASGMLAAVSGSNVTVSGSGGASLVLSGTLADINAYLTSSAAPVFTPDADFNGEVVFTMTSDDGGNTGGDPLTDIDTGIITVTPENDAPLAVDDNISTDEDTPVSFDPRDNDTDADNDPLIITGINGTSITEDNPVAVEGGTVSLNADGSLTFTPDDDFTGSPNFTYTVTDDDGITDEAIVNLTVNPVNDTPVNTVPGAQSVAEDTALSFSSTDGNAITVDDVEDGTLSVTLTVSNGTLSLSDTTGLTFSGGDGADDVTMTFSGTVADINAALDGAFYTPAADYNGPARFDIVTSDGTLSDSDSVAITVTPIADIAGDNATTDENTAVAIVVFANDTFENSGRMVTAVDGMAISAGGTAVTVANGTVSMTADGTLIYTPTTNFNGDTSFTYTVTSGGVTETATVNVAVAAVNAAPVNTLPATFNTLEDTSIVLEGLSVADNDAGAGTVNVSLSVDAGTLAASSAGGVTVSGSGSGTLTLSGSLADINAYFAGASAPVFTPVDNSTGNVTLTMLSNDNGNTGGPALTDTDTATITITPVNDAPAGADKAVTIAEDSTYTFTAADFGFADPDDTPDDSLQAVIITTLPANGALTLGGSAVDAGQAIDASAISQLQWTPDAEASGTALASFTFQVRDSGGTLNGGQNTDQMPNTFTFNVTAVNDAPLNTLPGPFAVNEDTALTLTGLLVADIDAGSGNLDITLSVDAGTLSATPGTGVTITGSGSSSITLTGTLDDLNAWLAATAPEFQPAADFNGTVTLLMLTDDLGNTGSGGALTDTDSASIVVAPVNDAPTGADDAITTVEDTPFNGSLPTATDVDGDTLTYSPGGTPPADGTVTINADGSYTYTPDPDFTGTDSFTYTVSDGSETLEYTVSVIVTPVNDPPVAANDNISTDEDTPVTFDPRVNDTDADGDDLTISAINGTLISEGSPVAVDGGSVSLNADGSLTFTPDEGFNGTADFTYTLDDSNGGTDQATVNLTVAAVNDAPLATTLPDQLSNDGDTITLDLSDAFTDPDGDSLSFTATGLPAGLSIDSVSGVISGMIDNSASTSDPYSVTVTATDTGGLDTSRNFAWTVNNPAPIAISDDFTTTENAATLAGSVLVDNGNGPDSDADGDDIIVSAVNGVAGNVGVAVAGSEGGTFIINADGSYSFDPGTAFDDLAAGDTLLTRVNYTISDGEGGVSTATVTIDVTGENDAPAAADDSFVTGEDVPVTFDVRLNDSDVDLTDTLTVTGINGTGIVVGGSVTVTDGTVMLGSDGQLTFTPDADFTGSTNFTYTVADDNGGTATATVTGTVNPANDAPAAVDDSFTTDEDTSVTIGVLDNDSDAEGDTLSIIEINGGAFTIGSPITVSDGTVTVNAAGTLLFEPGNDFNGNTGFTYTISDGNGGTATAMVTGVVGSLNDPPTASDTMVTTQEDMPIIGGTLPAANDPDGDTVTYSAGVTAPVNGTVTVNGDGTYDYTPDEHFNGTDSFSYVVSDGNGGVNEYLVTVRVTAENDPPVVSDPISDMVRADGDTMNFDLSPFFSDPDNDVLTYEVTGLPAGLTFEPTTGAITGTIDNNASQDAPGGVYTVTVTASDGNGGAVAETFTLTVTNPAPTAAADTATTNEDTAVNIDVLANDIDPDGDPLTLTSAEAGNGTVVIEADGTLTYTPSPDFNGTDTITYTISDGNGGVSTAQVTVTVNAINDDPVAAEIADFIDNDSTTIAGEDFASYFDDVDGDVLSFDATGLPAGLSMDANGLVSGTIDNNASQGGPGGDGAYTVDVTVDDGNGGTASRSFTWFIDNLPPTGFNDSLTVSEDDGAMGGDILANDTDPDGDGFGVSAVNGITTLPATVTGSAGGSFTVNADGTYSFIAGPAFADLQVGESRATSIVYTLQDDDGGEDTATLTVIVTGVNDGPTVTDGGLPDVTRADGTSLDSEPLDVSDYFHDPEQGGLTFSQTGLPAGLSIDSAGRITGTIASDASVSGPYTVTITATDDQGAELQEEFLFTVTNPAPTADNDTVFTPEDTPVNIPVLDNDSDPDGDTLGVVSAEAGNGAVTIEADGTLTYEPNPDFSGTDTIVYHISDGQGGESTATVTVNVASDNDIPVVDLDNTTSGLDYGATFTEGDAPVLVANGDASAFDVEDEIVSLEVALGGFVDAADELIHLGASATLVTDTTGGGTVTFGDTTFDYNYNPATGTLTFTNTAGPTVPMAGGDISVLLRGIRYENISESPTDGDRTLSFTATDAPGASSAGAVATISVVSVNDAPVAVDDSGTTDENTPIPSGTGDVLANDSEIDGGTLTVSSINGTAGAVGTAVAGSKGGEFTINADGSYSFDPGVDFAYLGAGESETSSITYTAADGQGGTTTAILTITVNGVNNAPVGADDALVTDEDTSFIGQLPAATDIDGDTLFYSVGTQPANGTVSVNGDGSYTYTPNPDFNGSDSFTYIVSDGTETVSYNVDVTVNPANDRPVAIDDAVETEEGAAVTFDPRDNDTDIEGDALNITGINGTAIATGSPVSIDGGTVSLNIDGTLTFTPDTGFNGNPGFTYSVEDADGATAQATVTITVSPVNDAPVAVDDAAVTGENTVVTGNVILDTAGRDSDVDGDTLTVSGINGAGGNVNTAIAGSDGGTFIVESDGSFSFDPGTDFDDLGEGASRVTSITYTVNDGAGGADTATLTVTVTGTNDAPVTTALSSRSDSDGAAVSLSAGDVFSDAEGDTLGFSATGLPPGLSIDSGTGAISGVIGNSASGPGGTTVYNVTVTADDGNGGTVSRSFDWTVTNPSPLAGDDMFTIAEDASLNGDLGLNDTDPDGDSLVASVVSGPGNGMVTLNPDGSFSYVPDADFYGTDSFIYQIDDGNGGSSSATVSINVTPVNDLPSGTDRTVTINEDTAYHFGIADFGFTDSADAGDALSQVTIIAMSSNGSFMHGGMPVAAGQVIDAADIARLSFTPAANANGMGYASFSFQVNDGSEHDPTPNIFTLNVNPVNDAPLNSLPSTYNTVEDTRLQLTGLAVADVDTADGNMRVTLSVDGGSLTASSADAVSVIGSGMKSIVLEGTLADINAYLAGPNAPFFTPDTDNSIPVSLTMVSNDLGNAGAGGALSDIDSRVIFIEPANDGPEAGGNLHTTPENTPVPGQVQASDADGDTLTFTLVEQLENGTVILNPDGSYLFTPGQDFVGTEQFDIMVDDGHGGITISTVTVNVTEVNNPPIATAPPLVVNEGVPGEGEVTTLDVDGDELTFTVEDAPDHGTLLLNPDGSYLYTPEPGYEGEDSFTVAVSDGNGGITYVTVPVTVNLSSSDVPPWVPPAQFTPNPESNGSADGPVAMNVVGAVLASVNGSGSLDGIAELNANAAVLQAVNGLAGLGGLQETILGAIANNGSSRDFWDYSPLRSIDASDLLSELSGSARSPDERISFVLEIQKQSAWLMVESLGQETGEEISNLQVSPADGESLPDWIRIDHHNNLITFDRPPNIDQLRLLIEVAHENGDRGNYEVSIDFNAVELQVDSLSLLDTGNNETDGVPFQEQLAQAIRQSNDVNEMLMQVLQ